MAIPLTKPLEFSNIEFDYVIIGGGTAGLAVAARLTEVSHLTVGVIEAGPAAFDEPLINVPGRLGQGLGSKYDWKFETTPQPGLNGNKRPWARGKVLGGSSAINFMAWNRGNREDYDAWEELGNPGWGWEGMLPFFKKSETFVEPSSAAQEKYGLEFDLKYHGDSGPVQTGFSSEYAPAQALFNRSVNNLGLETNHECLSGSNVGPWGMICCVDPQTATRSYAATAYYLKNAARPNLHVLTEALVSEIVVEQENGEWLAKGVRYSHGGQEYTASASREVILSAGSIQSPQLLELSGIGNPSILENAGIPVKVSNPNVGENLQDHLMTSTIYEALPSLSSRDDLRYDAALAEAAQKEYAEHKTGVLSSADCAVAYAPVQQFISAEQLADLAARSASVEGSENPKQREILARQFEPNKRLGQIEYILNIGCWSPFYPAERGKQYASLLQILQYPFSQGSIHIAPKVGSKPATVNEHPVIDPKYFLGAGEIDRKVLKAARQFGDKICSTAPLSDIILSRVFPPASDDDEGEEFEKNYTVTDWHPIGTCAMGGSKGKEGGVVDERLRVYGVKGLRVIDASIMPLHISCHLQATVYAVAEKGADANSTDLGPGSDHDPPPTPIANQTCGPVEYRKLCKTIEYLHTRIAVAEDILQSSSDTILNTAFGGRICSLREIKELTTSPELYLHESMMPRKCPGFECERYFGDAMAMPRHIRSLGKLGHQLQRKLLDQNYCFQCQREFGGAGPLAVHDKKFHGELTTFRFDSFERMGDAYSHTFRPPTSPFRAAHLADPTEAERAALELQCANRKYLVCTDQSNEYATLRELQDESTKKPISAFNDGITPFTPLSSSASSMQVSPFLSRTAQSTLSAYGASGSPSASASGIGVG
ncbi:hypothetical protein FQN53_001234 [Emmonsiellopsis sp. PD_33]|nr:hypothetical protein FQN53_001234 [Emmonsiellopsis sp. PD_33]